MIKHDAADSFFEQISDSESILVCAVPTRYKHASVE